MQPNITIQYQSVPRFDIDAPDALEYLEEFGFVVYANALAETEATHALALLWDYLEELGTGIDRNDISTWDDDRWPTSVHGAILPSYGIGHTAAQWYIRDIPKVKQAFANVWDTDDLLVSFDGVTIWRPWTHNLAWRTNEGNSWLHIDQHPIGRPGKHCVQGLVNLLPTSQATGGNVVVPGSHKRFDRIADEYTERLSRIHPSIDHFRFPNDDPALRDASPIMAEMFAGDLLLWDSRTIHCSAPGIIEPDSSTDLLRAASLICMMPRSKSNAEVIELRKAAVESRTSTTNWSDRFINADEFPQITAVEDSEKYNWPPIPQLSLSQLRMVGWTEEELAKR